MDENIGSQERALFAKLEQHETRRSERIKTALFGDGKSAQTSLVPSEVKLTIQRLHLSQR